MKTILTEVNAALREMGAVRGEQEFCTEWLGRAGGYMRTLRFTDTTPSAAALMYCAEQLEVLANASCADDDVNAQRLAQLAAQCRAEMTDKLHKQTGLRNLSVKYLSVRAGEIETPSSQSVCDASK